MSIFNMPIGSSYGQNIKPSDGAKLYFYESGTTTLKTVYAEIGETTPLSNPVVADANGRFPAIFISSNYKTILKDKNDVEIWSEDNLQGTNTGLIYLGGFDSSTNAGDYPSSGQTGDLYKVTAAFTLNAASGSHYLAQDDFIMANKANSVGIDADWEIFKGRIWIIDEDDFTSNSSVLAPSQQSTKAFIASYVFGNAVFSNWDITTVYAIGDYVKASDNKLYKALISQSGNTPIGDPTNWLPFGDLLNVLTSTDSSRALTAAQGKILKDVQDTLVGKVIGATETVSGLSFLRKRIIGSNGTDVSYDIDTAAGNFKFMDGSGSAVIGAYTKQLDAAWVAGTGAGGRPSGVSLSASTTYHYFALSKADGSVVDFGFDTSSVAANLIIDAAVVNHFGASAKYERQFSVITNATSTIIPFFQMGTDFFWKDRVLDLQDTAPGATAKVVAMPSIPLGVEVIGKFIMIASTSSNHYMLITSTDETDSVPSITNFTGAVVTEPNTTWFEIKMDILAQLRYRCTATTVGTFNVVTIGWNDINLNY